MRTIQLSSKEQQELDHLIQTTRDACVLKRAQALCQVASGEEIVVIARRQKVTRQTVHNWLRRFSRRSGSMAFRLSNALRSGRPAEKGVLVQALVPTLLAQPPEAFGYLQTGWTNALLRAHIEQHHNVRVSRFTVQRAVRLAGYRWKRPRYSPSRRSLTWRQAKGGSNAA